MARYIFICDPCEEHEEKIVREVFMSIQHFSNEGKNQTCDICGKLMRQEFGKPYVIYKGDGFYNTEYKKKLDPKNEKEMVSELTEHYVEKSHKSGDYDAALDTSETVVIDKYRDINTGKSVLKPVYVPPVKDE